MLRGYRRGGVRAERGYGVGLTGDQGLEFRACGLGFTFGSLGGVRFFLVRSHGSKRTSGHWLCKPKSPNLCMCCLHSLTAGE